MKRFIIELAICIACGMCAFALLQTCKHASNSIIVLDTDTITIVKKDTVYKHSYTPTYIPVEHYYTDTVHRYDTVFIVTDYKEVRVYLDTIRDTSFVVYLRDTVTQNKIVSRSYTGNSFSTTKYITNTIEAPQKLHIAIGPAVQYSNTIFSNPGILLQAHKQKFGGGVSLHQKGVQLYGLFYLR
ncbi:MAG TPA: hypothetical protein P5243_09460 [Bacteroidales bacterium]|nr:hypothetical protein [Bacteroidales bacterium]HRS19720.1 hypothetical protein [Bacteroidales bacterium]